MLKNILSSKNKINNQTFSKKKYTFLKSYFNLFLNIYTDIVHFIRTAYQLNLQSMGRPNKRKTARDSQLGRRKKESHGTNLLRGQWLLPGNCSYWNPTRAHFIIKRIGLRNTNIIRAYITVTMEMREATKITATF